jgi:hypothetical protein
MGSRNHVLHVGIDRYSSLAPDGSCDLLGAAHDVRRWSAYSRGALGVPAAQVRTLTDGEATREALLAALRALGAAVAADKGASGLVTFSGHGAALPDTGAVDSGIGTTAALVPADATRDGDALSGLVSLAEIEAALGDGAADTTIVVDACYTRVADADRPHRGLSDGAPSLPDRVASRLVLGAEPWGLSYEVPAGENWHGALSFALLTLLDQWTVRDPGGATWANVSYGDLVYRAHLQLDVWGLGQRPLLLGPARTSLLPFLRPGPTLAGGDTSPVPDRRRPGAQISIGDSPNGYRIVTVEARFGATWLTLANVIVVGSNLKHGYPTQNCEYWTCFARPAPLGTCTGYRFTVEQNREWWGQYLNDLATYHLAGPGAPQCAIVQSFQAKPPSWAPPATSLGGFASPVSGTDPKGVFLSVTTTAGTSTLTGVSWFVHTAGQSLGFWAAAGNGASVVFEQPFTPSGAVFVQSIG